MLMILGLLAVSAYVVGNYLASFHLGYLGYAQAVAADLAIARLAWFGRKYAGIKQRRWAIGGMAFFVAVQIALSYGYYATAAQSEPLVLRMILSAFIPVGIGLLGYLMGQRDSSAAFARKDDKPSAMVDEPPAKTETPVAAPIAVRIPVAERRGKLQAMMTAGEKPMATELAKAWGVSRQQVCTDVAAVRETMGGNGRK